MPRTVPPPRPLPSLAGAVSVGTGRVLIAALLAAPLCLSALPGPSARADISGGPATAAGEDPVPPPVIRDSWQRRWNTVEVSVRSDAPHWTLRSCPTAEDPEGSTVHAQGTGPKEVRVVVVPAFSWELVDRTEPVTFCAQAISDDGAGRTSLPVRTSVDLTIAPRFTQPGRDPASPDHGQDIEAGSWHRSSHQAAWGAPYGNQYVYEQAVPGVPVDVRRRSYPRGPWIWMGRFTTGRDGAFTAGYRHDGDTEIQVCRPETRCGTVLKDRIYGTTARVLSSAPATVRRNTTFPVYATILPRYAGRPVILCENHGPRDCRPRSTRRTDARGRVVFSVAAGSKRTSRSFRVWSPTHNGIYGEGGWTLARTRNVRIR
ncbi:MAG: hypothetical protein QG622_2907 [Actinomycetota bacterium]|nr:hypothetical protein [Actinomycetota bacterium]